MNDPVHGIVINLNAFGATVRLDDGELASVPAGDVEGHRAVYERALNARKRLTFSLRAADRRPIVTLVPQLSDDALDEQIAAYLRSTQEWDSPDGASAGERHFLQKKQRAAARKKA